MNYESAVPLIALWIMGAPLVIAVLTLSGLSKARGVDRNSLHAQPRAKAAF